MSCAHTFEHIYQTNFWQNGDGSGTGSTEQYTVEVSNNLIAIMQRYKIKSMLDAGCGACLWTQHFIAKAAEVIPGFQYLGLDASETAVSRAHARLRHVPCAQVRAQDLTQHPIPTGQFDLIFSRDSLQHLSFTDCKAVLQNFSQANAKVVVIGSYLTDTNKNIVTGDCYDINLLLSPFNLWPNEIMSERTPLIHPQKHMFIYNGFRLS